MCRIFFLLLCLFNTGVFAQDPAYASKIVTTLASPEFKGRGYVENGNLLAAEYIKNQFLEIGLLPVKKDFYQTFGLSVNTFPAEMEVRIAGSDLVAGRDFLVDPSSPSVKGTFEVHIIHKSDLKDAEKVKTAVRESAGKILVIDERNFVAENKADLEKADNLIQFFKYEKLLQLAGTCIISSDKLNWNISGWQSSHPSISVNSDIRINENSRIRFNIDARMNNVQTANITGIVPGTSVPDSFIVIVAHYDHLGKMGSQVYFPGANDNASGVAMLLSLAKYFKANPVKYSVAFIALAAEESGVVGARYFADNPLFDLNKIRFLINFDLAGTGDEGIKVVNGSVFKDQFDLLKKLNDEGNYLKSVQVRGPACNSDHCMFYEKGVPCFYIYTLGGITAYHDIYDRADTLPLTFFSDYCTLMIKFLQHISHESQ